MMIYLLRTCLAVFGVIGATFLPYSAGGYDLLAVPLGTMAWALGRVCLLLVPIGGLWLWASMRKHGDTRSLTWLVWITRGTTTLISLVMVFVAFASSGSLLVAAGIAGIAVLLDTYIAGRLRSTCSEPSLTKMVAACLTVAPVIVLTAQMTLIDPIMNHARDRLIMNSAPLIDEIESFRIRHGVYPQSLFSIWGDCKPSVVGVDRYHYEQSGDSYNLIIGVPSLEFGVRRFVVYNPTDKQRVTVHEQDRLLLSEQELDADNAGYTLIQSLLQPHWKLFLFLS